MFSIDASGLLRRWERATRALADRITKSAEVAAKEGAEYAKAFGTFKDRTGMARRMTRGVSIIRGRWVGSAWLESRVPYASILDGGSKPHEIRPRPPNTVLRFIGRNGNTVFARKVNHPGTKPYGYMGAGMLKAERVLEREARSAAKDAETAFHEG
jgi:hypothetical protein